MKCRHRSSYFTFLVLFACFMHSPVGAKEPYRKDASSPIDFGRLKSDYGKLGQDWKKKRAFCIELIDEQIIEDGARLPALLKVFGNDVFVIGGDASSECSASILFEKQPASANDNDVTRAEGHIGWYLWIESNRFGQVTDYHLSNRHK